jgi:hypothetical protein
MVREREREKETDRQTDRQTDSECLFSEYSLGQHLNFLVEERTEIANILAILQFE